MDKKNNKVRLDPEQKVAVLDLNKTFLLGGENVDEDSSGGQSSSSYHHSSRLLNSGSNRRNSIVVGPDSIKWIRAEDVELKKKVGEGTAFLSPFQES